MPAGSHRSVMSDTSCTFAADRASQGCAGDPPLQTCRPATCRGSAAQFCNCLQFCMSRRSWARRSPAELQAVGFDPPKTCAPGRRSAPFCSFACPGTPGEGVRLQNCRLWVSTSRGHAQQGSRASTLRGPRSFAAWAPSRHPAQGTPATSEGICPKIEVGARTGFGREIKLGVKTGVSSADLSSRKHRRFISEQSLCKHRGFIKMRKLIKQKHRGPGRSSKLNIKVGANTGALSERGKFVKTPGPFEMIKVDVNAGLHQMTSLVERRGLHQNIEVCVNTGVYQKIKKVARAEVLPTYPMSLQTPGLVNISKRVYTRECYQESKSSSKHRGAVQGSYVYLNTRACSKDQLLM